MGHESDKPSEKNGQGSGREQRRAAQLIKYTADSETNNQDVVAQQLIDSARYKTGKRELNKLQENNCSLKNRREHASEILNPTPYQVRHILGTVDNFRCFF